MPETCIFNLSQFAGTIVSACVGGGIGYWSAVRVSRLNARAGAAAKLRASFAPAQAKLFRSKSVGERDLREFFDTVFLDHAAAFEEFRPFVSDGLTYQNAWDEYQKTIYTNDALGDANLRWMSGMMVNENGDNTLDFLDVIDQRIKTILEVTH